MPQKTQAVIFCRESHLKFGREGIHLQERGYPFEKQMLVICRREGTHLQEKGYPFVRESVVICNREDKHLQ